eukprot:jgi/Botrbrau1/5122/Bobra.0128s0030.1
MGRPGERAGRVEQWKGGSDGTSRVLVSNNGCMEDEGGWCMSTINVTVCGMLTLWD